MADPHHHAARHHQRRRREAELLGAQQRGDDHVAAGLHLPVDLHVIRSRRPLASSVCCVSARPSSHGEPACLSEVSGAAPVPPSCPEIRTTSACALLTPGRDRADPDLADQLDVHPRLVVGVLEVVDELLEVLDRVDVVVRRRADQADARRRVPGARHPRVDLAAGQLAALAGLGALRHLDLDVVGVDQVLAGDAEPARGHLLDRRAAQVAVRVGQEAVGVLAALAGVGLAAEPVHRDRQRLVRLGGDRAVAHRAGGEPLDDLADRLDLVDRHGRPHAGLQREEPAQGGGLLGQLVDGLRVLLEDVVLPRPGGVLEQEHRLGVEQVHLALAAPLVLPAGLQPAVRPLGRVLRVGAAVAHGHLLGEDVDADAAERAGGAGEVLVDEVLGEPDGLEDLRHRVRADGADAHLAHDLEHALAERLDHVADGLARAPRRSARRRG